MLTECSECIYKAGSTCVRHAPVLVNTIQAGYQASYSSPSWQQPSIPQARKCGDGEKRGMKTDE